MLRPIDNYFLQKEEPGKSCLQFLREHINNFIGLISELLTDTKSIILI
jgi:hypothetical protein